MITDIEQHILDSIDKTVEHGSEDELFAGGYLRGHLTLAVAELEQIQDAEPQALKLQVEQSLSQAIKAGELSPPDQTLVTQLWEDLYQQAVEATLLVK
ncbi:YfcL family protein [Rosenbergiella australiborealis]|uniref:YfcL family protein n=1 Tax=Rosenbergiella australiborealis TaxID=1544696 RepID=A0ABS5T2Z7_9GAMM|nr:YfcL family protein [Rosenbergiella australiborealis]MBT0726719.1 YfcL family protein [Rosenbergiella australiborealis]